MPRTAISAPTRCWTAFSAARARLASIGCVRATMTAAARRPSMRPRGARRRAKAMLARYCSRGRPMSVRDGLKCECSGESAPASGSGPRKDTEELEPVIEDLRHLVVGSAVRRTEHHGEKPVAAAARRGDQAAQRNLGPAGLEAERARVGTQQLIQVDQ